jgi:hypothetical protein
MENKSLTFAQIAKTEEIIQNADELKGKFDPNDTVEVQKRGSKDPVKVLSLAAATALKIKERSPLKAEVLYAPLKSEVLEIALSILKGGTEEQAVTAVIDDKDDDEVAQVPASTKPNTSTPVGTVEHSDISRKIASDLGIDLATVEKITGAFVSQVSGSFVLGLVALANSLHFIAASHDKMPGSEARVKAIDDIRRQYVEAGTLTSRKSRS